MTLLANKTLGRYQLMVAIARGGMGQVWLGRLQGARGFSKLVAIKTLLPTEQDLPRFEAMLAEEARLASLIQHANVVHTLELGEHEGLLYLVMDWVDGEPLGFLLKRANERGGMPIGVAVALLSQVLAGLHAVHELSDAAGPLGVVHRDVSPHNILVTYEGVAKLLDFGIAKATQQTTQNTQTGEVKGKFSYMAPEQILGSEVDRRCDVFAAGIVLYLLTTGRHPFKRHNTAAVIHAITADDPVAPPSTVVEDYPSELERVVLKALEKDAEKRWTSAEEMRAALEQALPEAFGDAARADMREFMDRAVGDRKLARREAVRRAQIRADEVDLELGSGSHKALQAASAQSATSLRAISISKSDVDELLDAPSGAVEQQKSVATRPKRTAKAAWLTASAGVVLALAVALPHWLAPHTAERAAAVRLPAGAPLSGLPAASSPLPLTPPAAATTAAAATTPTAATPAASITAAPSTPAPSVHVPPSAKLKSAVTKKASTKPSAVGPNDLLAPDYAR